MCIFMVERGWGKGMLQPIILHADLDCFYCQVERIRLSLPDTQPMAVQQWHGVIAVNYPARARGVTRHSRLDECLTKCPEMVFVHVPTYSIRAPGEVFRYAAKGATESEPVPRCPDRSEHKASLAPYRKASALIFRVFERHADVLEKAGLDEAFMDITKRVDEMFQSVFDCSVTEAGNWEGLSEAWSGLDFTDLGVPAMPYEQTESTASAMVDDLRIWLGARMARDIRMALRDELGYTCSIGIGHNKMLAKLGSARNKPFNQTFILQTMVEPLMQSVPLGKIRFLGGKLGALLMKAANEHHLEVEREDNDDAFEYSDDEENGEDPSSKEKKQTMASDLWPLSHSELTNRLGGESESAAWVHAIIRGVDRSAVTPRSKPKSFMAAKTLRPALKSWQQVDCWLRLLAAELWERLEEDSQVNQRWPRTVSVQYWKSGAATQSTGGLFTGGKAHSGDLPIFSPDLFTVDLMVGCLMKMLEHQAQQEPGGSIFPLFRLTIAVSRFAPIDGDGKRWSTLDRFFSGTKRQPPDFDALGAKKEPEAKKMKPSSTLDHFIPKPVGEDTWQCRECSKCISMWEIDQIQEHQDYHLARKLEGA